MRYKLHNLFSQISFTGFYNILCLIALAFFTLLVTTFLFNHSTVFKELGLKETVPSLIAFANDTVVEEDAILFANQIQKNEDILYIDFFSKEDNLNRAEKQFGSLGRLIKDALAGNNRYHASLEIYVDSADGSRKQLEEIAFEIEAYDEIDDVVLTGQGILTDLYHQTNRTTIACVVITVVFTLLVLRASIVKTGQTRHEEIILLDLIGATRTSIKFPFYFQGIFLGLFGTTLGLTCFYLLYCLFTFQLGVLEFLPYYQLISIVGAGVIIGLLAGILAHKKYIKSCRSIINSNLS